MGIFLRLRFKVTAQTDLQAYLAEDALSRCTQFVVQQVNLISGFHQRPKAVQRICEKAGDLNYAAYLRDKLHVTNTEFGPVMMTVMIALYLIYSGELLATGSMKVSQVLARMTSLTVSAAAWNLAYKDCLLLQSAVPALEIVVRYLNLPTDLSQRMEMNRRCGQISLHKREDLANRKGGRRNSVVVKSDYIPIELMDVKFSYADVQNVITVYKTLQADSHLLDPFAEAGHHVSVFGKWDLQIRQGTLAALVGHHGQGKTTILNMLGSIFLPTVGTVFVPPHLRVFYVTQEPMFLAGDNLYENLLYGSDKQNVVDTSMERVLKICRDLHIPEHVIEIIEKGEHIGAIETSLSEQVQLHLVRVLVANPEVIVAAKPTLSFSNFQETTTMKVFHKHVREKGLHIAKRDGKKHSQQSLSHSLSDSRRPRTLICTANRVNAVDIADDVFLVTKTAVTKIDASQVETAMLD